MSEPSSLSWFILEVTNQEKISVFKANLKKGVDMDFGNHIRRIRQRHYRINRRYSIKRVAERIGVDPYELERIERNRRPPDQEVLQRLANDLGENMDLLLALVGEIAGDIRETIIRRPVLFTELIRGISDLPDKKLIMLIREAKRNRSSHSCKPVARIVDQ